MKKILSVILCVTLLAGSCVISGCNNSSNNSNKSNVAGKEIAKMLLANQRLDSADLSIGLYDAIIDSVTINNVSKSNSVSGKGQMVDMLTSTNGNTISWSDFSNECNAYVFFKSYFDNIENNAKQLGELIDTIKAECGITDYWITGYGYDKVLLKVEANQEIIFVKDDVGYSVCRRYTNEDADDVYEIYRMIEGSNDESRTLYIPGKRYEYSSEFGADGGLYIVAENTRGYWNMFQLLDMEKERCNIMNLVSTGSMAFTFDDSRVPGIPKPEEYQLSFSTTDLSNDIIKIGPYSVEMNLSAFNGINRIEASSENVWQSEGSNHLTESTGTLYTISGKKLTDSREYDEEAPVSVMGMVASFTKNYLGENNHLTRGQLMLRVKGDSCSEQMTNFKTFLAENGMTCKYDLNYITGKYAAAQEIAKNFRNTYKWNGYSIKDYTGIAGAAKVEKDRYSEFSAMYEAVKNAKTVENTQYGTSFKDWDFSKINSIQCGNVTMTDNKISVENMTVTVNNTAIFDTEEKYTVCLALAKFVNGSETDYDNAVIMECEGADVTAFAGSAITLNQTATFALPRCAAEGQYTVVAYVATEDGIRVSEMVPVIFSEDIEKSETYEGFVIDYKVNDKHEIRIDCSTSIDRYIKPEDVSVEYTYESVYEVLKQSAAANGYFVEGAVVELYDAANDTVTQLTSDSNISGGVYRMAYLRQVGNTEVSGYIYLVLE